MNDATTILQADRGQRIRAAIPALVLIVCLSVVALWLSIPFGPFGVFAMLLFITGGVVLFLMRTTSVELSVADDAVVVRNTLRTTRVPVDEVEGMALTPDGQLQVLTKKRSVVVEVADGRHEEDVAVAAEQMMEEVDRRAPDPVPVVSPYAAADTEASNGDASTEDAATGIA